MPIWAARFDPGEIDAMPQADDDEDLDPENYLPCYMAACAAAGGMNGRPSASDLRRAFWLWYLDEAVPAAYGLAGKSMISLDQRLLDRPQQ